MIQTANALNTGSPAENPTLKIATDVGRNIGMARSAQNRGDTDAMRRHAETVIEMLKSIPLNYENLDWRQLAEGDAQWLLGNHAAAEKAFRQAMVAAPQQLGGYQRLYELLIQVGRTEDAQKHLETCIKKFPKTGFFLKQLAVLAAASDNYDVAIPALANAFAADENDHEAADGLGLCLQNINHFAEAVLYHARAVESDPSNVEYVIHFGTAMAGTDGGLEAAADLFRFATTLNPNAADAYAHLGYTLQKLEKNEESREAYEKGLSIAPNHPGLNYNYAGLLQDLGNTRDAVGRFDALAKSDSPIAPSAEFLRASITGENTPETAPEQFVKNLFNFYAPQFEASLIGKLQYRSPGVLHDLLLRPEVTNIRDIKAAPQRILDLGCGTGLMGVVLREFASELVGVDLSANMLMRANEKGIYSATHCQDIHSYLADMSHGAFDVVVASDLFIYVGKLDNVFALLGQKLSSGSLVAIACEELAEGTPGPGYGLRDTARYAHKDSYIRQLASKNGFTVTAFDNSPIRNQKGQPIAGIYYIFVRG